MISINILNDFNIELSYKKQLIDNCVKEILISKKINNAEISIILTDKEYLSKLKKEYFKVDQYTDVIAFNLEDEN